MRFRNITCLGENGVLVHGTENNPIKDVSFENLQVTLNKSSKWNCGIYDLRPAIDVGITESKNSCIFIKNAENVTIEKAFAKYGTVCDSYAHGLYAENVKNLDLIRFTAESAGESIDSIKII